MKVFRGILTPSIIILFFLTTFSPALAQEELSVVIAKIQPSVVLILTYDAEGEIQSQGSGFFISEDGDVITSRHVLLGTTSADIKTQEGNVYAITDIVAEDKEGDIIRISTNIPTGEAAPLSICETVPKVGEKVIVLGSPFGLEQTASDGIVSAVRDIPGFGNIIQITAPISAGSSGSPVVNITREVIGIAAFQFIEGQNLNFAMPAERVMKLTAGNEQSLAEWGTGTKEDWIVSAEGLCYSGYTFFLSEDYEKALYYFEEAIKKDSNYADAYFYIGYCKGELGRYNEEIEAYKQAIRIDPDYTDAHNNLGVAYGALGRYDDAIEAYKQAIRIKPDYALAHNNLGVAYGALGRYDDAIEAYKQAIRIKPDYAEAHYNLGCVYGNSAAMMML